MPLKEATFWSGITVFGTGLFGWMEGGDRMPYGVGLTILGLAVVVYSVWAHHQPNLPKLPLWIPLLMVTWVAIGFDYYVGHYHGALPEFDDANFPQPLVTSYGGNEAACWDLVNGKDPQLLAYTDKYKLAIACFVFTGTQDVLDTPQIQIGKSVYDIKPQQTLVMAPYSPQFIQLLNATRQGTISLALLLIPNGIETSQFSTLRQARALGVKIVMIQQETSPPSATPNPTSKPTVVEQ